MAKHFPFWIQSIKPIQAWLARLCRNSFGKPTAYSIYSHRTELLKPMRYPNCGCFTHSFKSDISGRNHAGHSIPWRFSAFGDPEKLLSIEVLKATKKKTDSSSCETSSKWMSFHDYFIGRPAWRSCRAHLSQTHSFQSAIVCNNPTTFPPDFAQVNEGRTPCEGFFCCFPWLNLWLSHGMHMEISYAAFQRDPRSFPWQLRFHGSICKMKTFNGKPPLEGEILAKHLEKQNRKLYCPTVKKLFDEPCSLSSHKP